MIPQNAVITASVLKDSSRRSRAVEIGTVVRVTPEKHAIIATPAGTLTVDIEQGALEQGQRVAVFQRDEKVLIAQLSASHQQMRQAPDQFVASRLGVAELVALLEYAQGRLGAGAIHDELRNELVAAVSQLSAHSSPPAAELHDAVLRLISLLGETPPRINAIAESIESVHALLRRETGMQPAQDPACIVLSDSLPAGSASPGFVYTTGVRQAAEYVSTRRVGIDVSNTNLRAVFGDRGVYVRIIPERELGRDGSGLAVILCGKRVIEAELAASIERDAVSQTMRRLPPESLCAVVRTCGEVSLDSLLHVDKMLASAEAHVAAGARAEPMQAQALEQWLATALSQRLPAWFADIAVRSAHDVPMQIQELVQNTGAQIDSLLDALSVDIDGAVQRPKPSWLSTAIRALGLDFDHALLQLNPENAREAHNHASLKYALIRALIEHADAGSTIERDSPESLPSRTHSAQASEGAAPAPGIADQSLETTHTAAVQSGLWRGQAISAIERLESMQLLARPARTAEGEQQVLAIPVRLDDEWSEMQIHLLKKRGGKRAKRPSRFTLNVHVAPSALGSVDAKIEYAAGKSCVIDLGFEKPAVRSWFERRASDIVSGLGQLGLRGVRLTCRTIRTSTDPRGHVEPDQGESLDITI
jgi:hypothetical protein